MKLFIDTANLADIEGAFKGGLISGVTTNPSLLSKEPKSNYLVHMKKIVALCRKLGKSASLSVEVFTADREEMVEQALDFSRSLKYKNLAIKIPISYKGESYLGVVRKLAGKGIAVNCTACMTPMQLMLGAAAGARFVRLFNNRVKDGGTEKVYEAERRRLEAEKTLEPSDYDP